MSPKFFRISYLAQFPLLLASYSRVIKPVDADHEDEIIHLDRNCFLKKKMSSSALPDLPLECIFRATVPTVDGNDLVLHFLPWSISYFIFFSFKDPTIDPLEVEIVTAIENTINVLHSSTENFNFDHLSDLAIFLYNSILSIPVEQRSHFLPESSCLNILSHFSNKTKQLDAFISSILIVFYFCTEIEVAFQSWDVKFRAIFLDQIYWQWVFKYYS